jgi:hypothetical protein
VEISTKMDRFKHKYILTHQDVKHRKIEEKGLFEVMITGSQQLH